MRTPGQGWLEFWNQQRTFSERFLQGNASLFFERSRALLDLRSHDEVLDLGAGSGHLSARIAPLVQSVCAVEGAPSLLTGARERLRHLSNVRWVHADLARDPLPAALSSEGYSVVLCHSVLQYLPSHSAVEWLLDAVSERASRAARLLFADLPGQRALLADAASQLRHGFGRGFGLDVLWALPIASLSRYAQLRQRAGVLTFSRERLLALGRRIGGRARVIEGELTANASRLHLFVER
jgi:SAM-dependent methyltransferase